jgi:hypothetical protein
MAQTATPYGMRPVDLLGGVPYAGAIRSFPLLANSAKAFYFGDPVGIVLGQLTALVASPTTTITANNPIGVFMGCEWQDPVRGFVNSQYCPANLITGGATQVKFKILDHPKAVFRIQANGSVPLSAIAQNVQFLAASVGTGNTATGNSLLAADPAYAVTATFALTIVGFPNQPGSAPGDPFTDLLVIWNQGVHHWEAAAGF